MIFTICGIYQEAEMGRECSIRGRDGKCTFLLRNQKQRDNLGDLDVDARMVLKWNV
jgi:hypothetical protein